MAASQEALVRTFVQIVGQTQTRQLHEWNRESLSRALQWAGSVEAAAASARAGNGADLRDRFPLASLPTLAAGALLCWGDLQRATQHLLCSIVQSPFLGSHPVRSELFKLVLDGIAKQRRSDPESPLVAKEFIASLLAKQTVQARRARTALSIAHTLTQDVKPVNVRVAAGCIAITPLGAYLALPRTVHLRSLAATLQANAVNACAASDEAVYRRFLQKLEQRVHEDSTSDTLEVLGLLLTHCPWPSTCDQSLVKTVRADISRVVLERMKDRPVCCMALPSWLAATLASAFEAFAAVYVPYLLERGFLEPESEFAARVATISLQSEALEAAVHRGLELLDPLVLDRFLSPLQQAKP